MSGLRPAERPPDKSPDAFRTISEVAEDLDLPQHVLRFWETRFAQIRPLKRGGGRRYYRPDDVDLLKGIRHLLYGEGYTIKGVQRILKEEGARFVQSVGRGEQKVAAPPGGAAGTPPASSAQALAMAPGSERQDSQLGAGPKLPAALAPPTSSQAAGPDWSAAAVARLRAVLAELEECDRVLASLKAQTADLNS